MTTEAKWEGRRTDQVLEKFNGHPHELECLEAALFMTQFAYVKFRTRRLQDRIDELKKKLKA